MMDAIEIAKSKVDKEGFDLYSQEIKLKGQPAWIMVKSVIASDKSCYSCHIKIKEGAPIGQVMAILTKRQP